MYIYQYHNQVVKRLTFMLIQNTLKKKPFINSEKFVIETQIHLGKKKILI